MPWWVFAPRSLANRPCCSPNDIVSKLELSICTVVYKSDVLTTRFHREILASLARHDAFEILYYDNSPDDALADALSTPSDRVHYVSDPRNLGFSYANNALIARARFQKILLLNPDVFGFTHEFWPRAVNAQRGDVVFARLLNSDGSFQDCVGDTTSVRRALMPTKDYSGQRERVNVGMGIMAFMLTDRTVLDRVGLLDCDYPLYCEDMDWCLRARKLDVPLVFEPALELTHVGGASAFDRWNAAGTMQKKYAAERIYIDKHFRGLHRRVMLLLNRLKAARGVWRARQRSS